MNRIAALLLFATMTPAATVRGPVAVDGTEVQLDLPRELHVRNRGGSDGAGLCVFASIKHAALWQSAEPLERIFEYMFTRPGGGWPAKVDQVIRTLCQEAGRPVPEYLQVQDNDLEILRLACRTGRMPGVTYGFSPAGRYGGARISHMVSLVHADDKWFAILDNNFPGTIEWMSPTEFRKTYTQNGRWTGWAVILLDGGPPPVPWN